MALPETAVGRQDVNRFVFSGSGVTPQGKSSRGNSSYIPSLKSWVNCTVNLSDLRFLMCKTGMEGADL